MQHPYYSSLTFVLNFAGWRNDGRFYCLVEIVCHPLKMRQPERWFEIDFGKEGGNENSVAWVPSC